MCKLVSIITPCYNGKKYLVNFLNSILDQDYKQIELIFIDDGSTDCTADIVNNYKKKFENSGIIFKYIYQENAGQAAAINKGLKEFKGEYLMWVDSDDILLKNNISKKVEFLEKHDECGFVLSKGTIVNENSLDNCIGYLERKYSGKEDLTLFSDLVLENNVIFGPGTIMVRRECIIRSIKDLNIYENREGQNWQLMLPLAYYYKPGYINEPLFKYVVHQDSHSRTKKKITELVERHKGMEDILINTINRIEDMGELEKNKWKKIIKVKYLRMNIQTYYRNFNFKKTKELKKSLKKYNEYTYRDNFAYWFMSSVISKIKR